MIVEKKVGYEHEGRKFEGMIVYDDSVKAKRPVLFMQPDWAGVCEHTLEQAREIAGKDYVVLMADMFGEGYGARQKTVDDLMKSSRGVRGNVPFINSCGAKALDVLGAEADKAGLVDLSRKVAVGYCIGGGYVLSRHAPAPISKASSCSTSPRRTRCAAPAPRDARSHASGDGRAAAAGARPARRRGHGCARRRVRCRRG